MLIIRGRPAYSDFYLERLKHKLQLTLPTIASVYAVTVFFVQCDQALSEDERDQLFELLSSKDELDPNLEQQMIVVLPRRGTISPWSAKATDIAYNCGLEKITRLERGVIFQITQTHSSTLTDSELQRIYPLLYDPMLETLGSCLADAEILFGEASPGELLEIDMLKQGMHALERANQILGLALLPEELNNFGQYFEKTGRNPTDVEMMMFAQIQSEHCRHKVFNSRWIIDGKKQKQSLMEMLQYSCEKSSQNLIPMHDNKLSVFKGNPSKYLDIDAHSHQYQYVTEDSALVFKVETHNHPTAISPYSGAATGVAGEIRNEVATGRGASPKAAIAGYAVSHLHLPHHEAAWERPFVSKPAYVSSALEIMLEAPVGAAQYNNEFGRPLLCGYFRSFEYHPNPDNNLDIRGYHKPVMLTGGIGHVRMGESAREKLAKQVHIVVLGGPSMMVGVGGGTISSMTLSEERNQLDYAAVQKGHPEMARRAFEVIARCAALGSKNPILSIQDVGAGGLANSVPDILVSSHVGGRFELRAIPNDDLAMPPLGIWCNESQERFVVAVREQDLDLFYSIADRERCLYSQIGEVSNEPILVLGDGYFDTIPVEVHMDLLYSTTEPLKREVTSEIGPKLSDPIDHPPLDKMLMDVLQHPSVASKNFLVTISDRSVGGLTVRDQMVGPWQVPVADAAVTATGFAQEAGEAIAIGERAPLSLLDSAASARMSVGEALTNIVSADVTSLSDVIMSTNWQSAIEYPQEALKLYEAVKAVAIELCPLLSIAMPVGKESLSMQMSWNNRGEATKVVSPMTLVVTAMAKVADVNKSLTPELIRDENTQLLFIDLAAGAQRLGGSIAQHIAGDSQCTPPDFDQVELFKAFFAAMTQLKQRQLLLAYHDRSDGGLWATCCEMAFAGHVGLQLDMTALGSDPYASLLNEELGVVVQIRQSDRVQVDKILQQHKLQKVTHPIGLLIEKQEILVIHQDKILFRDHRVTLQRLWSKVTYNIQSLRDNPECAAAEYDSLLDEQDPGLHAVLTFDYQENAAAPYIKKKTKPEIAILREQGCNSHRELAAAFDQVGFRCVDVHMSDIIESRISLQRFKGLAVSSGFSFGDVLGAGFGWAKSILFNAVALEQFSLFFAREDTFTLGVSNGCQMLSHLNRIIPGSELWPRFSPNRSEQFESRLVMVEIQESPSILFKDMAGTRLPVVVAHAEGRMEWQTTNKLPQLVHSDLVSLRFCDNYGEVTERYPANPNGSFAGITGLTSQDGRATILMPQPERAFLTQQCSWHPKQWLTQSPWSQIFLNARKWVG